jgi:hypothetical protein
LSVDLPGVGPIFAKFIHQLINQDGAPRSGTPQPLLKGQSMETEILIHKCRFSVAGQDYEVLVYSRPDGSHVAKTFFTSQDVIINDGPSFDDVLSKHQRLLPLAVNSRLLLKELRRDL